MSQEKIWDYFQGEGISNFDDAIPRLRFLVRRARALVSVSQPRVLNIGVGNGWLERECLQLGWRVSALDPSESAILNLSKDGIDARIGYIEAMPFNAEIFDIVFCSEVLEHLRDEQLASARKEIARVLKPEGWIIGTVPNNENLMEGLVVCADCGMRFHRWGHHQSFDLARMSAFLRDGGFSPEIVKTYAFPVWRPGPLINRIRQSLRWVLGQLGSAQVYCNIYFAGKKV